MRAGPRSMNEEQDIVLGTKILIVEDEGIVASDIEQQLLLLGYDPVGVVSTGEAALSLARMLRPRLILMDIHLSGEMDGIEAATLIRAELAIPSIFLTAYATDDVVERAKRAEPLGYIVKPFDEHSLGTTIEIALHKDQLDVKLRQSEARFRAVVQTAHDAIVTVDGDGQIVGWSPAAAAMFGYTETEAIGQRVSMLMPQHRQSEYLKTLRSLMTASPAPVSGGIREVEGQRKNGSCFPLELSMAKWETADGWFLTGFMRDLSERRRADRFLRLQSAALNAAANGIVITDLDGTIEWVNPAFSAVTGYRRDEAIGKNPRDLVRSGAHSDSFYAEMWRTLISGRVWRGELVNRRKDGTHYTEEQTITPVRNEEGEITHFIGIKRDLTEEKRLQEQFLQAQKMEVVGRLAGGIAHDFNNLLTVINGTTSMVLMALSADSPLRADFELIDQAGGRAAALTRQLLAFSRKQVLAPMVLNLGQHVKNTASILRRLIGEDIKLVVDVAADVHNVLADPGQLEQVLMNLAVNGRDAMPHGGTLTIAAYNFNVDHASTEDPADLTAGPYVVVKIADTGVGMSPEIRTRIFEPFFTTKENGKGTGLGLATVYGIVKQSAGSLSVESEPGRGSSFKVFLPSVEAVATAESPAAALLARGNETVALVEDEPDLRDMAMRMLEAAGYIVLPATSSADALSILEHHEGQIHLLFTDVVMPDMSGPSLVAAAVKLRPGIRFLLTSGYADESKLSDSLLADPRCFIAKPYYFRELAHKVRQVLDAKAPGIP
jgi:two-component system cell cycle sensor histidine kinase/response regulator CckA